MCAVIGMLNNASVNQLCAVPPVRSASRLAMSLATGRNVGVGLSGSCRVAGRHRRPGVPPLGPTHRAEPVVWMAPMKNDRLDQPRGLVTPGEPNGSGHTGG